MNSLLLFELPPNSVPEFEKEQAMPVASVLAALNTARALGALGACRRYDSMARTPTPLPPTVGEVAMLLLGAVGAVGAVAGPGLRWACAASPLSSLLRRALARVLRRVGVGVRLEVPDLRGRRHTHTPDLRGRRHTHVWRLRTRRGREAWGRGVARV